MNNSPNHQIRRTPTPSTSQELPVEFCSMTLRFSSNQRLLDLSWRSLPADKKRRERAQNAKQHLGECDATNCCG